MNKEELFKAIGTIDDELIKRSEKTTKKNKSVIWGSIAACFIVVAGMGALYLSTDNKEDIPIVELNMGQDMAAAAVDDEEDTSSYEEIGGKKESASPDSPISGVSDLKMQSSSSGSMADEDSDSDSVSFENDVAVDESTYNEARKYSDEIMDLQNRISSSMANGELPYVIETAIYENPDRVHVVVTTQDEELINKLKAYDTTGNLLEIEYRADEVQVKDY